MRLPHDPPGCQIRQEIPVKFTFPIRNYTLLPLMSGSYFQHPDIFHNLTLFHLSNIDNSSASLHLWRSDCCSLRRQKCHSHANLAWLVSVAFQLFSTMERAKCQTVSSSNLRLATASPSFSVSSSTSPQLRRTGHPGPPPRRAAGRMGRRGHLQSSACCRGHRLRAHY